MVKDGLSDIVWERHTVGSATALKVGAQVGSLWTFLGDCDLDGPYVRLGRMFQYYYKQHYYYIYNNKKNLHSSYSLLLYYYARTKSSTGK